MEVSLMGSFGSHVFVTSLPGKSAKLSSLSQKERVSLSLQCSKFKPCQTKIVMCKNEFADFEERTSPNEKEIARCYELVHRLGRGVVYMGSSRMGPHHPHYLQATEVGREVLVGLMDAATKGALEAGKSVAGFKIAREAGEWTASIFHPYLPSETYHTCRFSSARKHGIMDASVRNASSDRTAVIALPGGVGTLDEMFEILALIHLERIGSELPVPFLVMNYDSYYKKLFDFLADCEEWGTVSKREVASLWKAFDNNSEALAYLTDFYHLSSTDTETQALGTKIASSH